MYDLPTCIQAGIDTRLIVFPATFIYPGDRNVDGRVKISSINMALHFIFISLNIHLLFSLKIPKEHTIVAIPAIFSISPFENYDSNCIKNDPSRVSFSLT